MSFCHSNRRTLRGSNIILDLCTNMEEDDQNNQSASPPQSSITINQVNEVESTEKEDMHVEDDEPVTTRTPSGFILPPYMIYMKQKEKQKQKQKQKQKLNNENKQQKSFFETIPDDGKPDFYDNPDLGIHRIYCLQIDF